MVFLRITPECEKGDHSLCAIGQSSPPGVYGGWRCTCHCHNTHEEKPNEIQLLLKLELEKATLQ